MTNETGPSCWKLSSLAACLLHPVRDPLHAFPARMLFLHVVPVPPILVVSMLNFLSFIPMLSLPLFLTSRCPTKPPHGSSQRQTKMGYDKSPLWSTTILCLPHHWGALWVTHCVEHPPQPHVMGDPARSSKWHGLWSHRNTYASPTQQDCVWQQRGKEWDQDCTQNLEIKRPGVPLTHLTILSKLWPI